MSASNRPHPDRSSRDRGHVVSGGAITAHAGPVPSGPASTRPSATWRVLGSRVRARGVPGGDDGFTLVELLVVVAVLVTLVGIAIPAFSAQQERAWDAAVRAQLRAGTIALASYQAQNASYSAVALDPAAGWGYEPSSIVVAHWSGFSDDSYCGRAWRRTDLDTEGDDLAAVAGERVQFAATPDGIFAVTAPWSCP
jgi:prepilin-type N-terminal cleavage/methylation domain-containing protein